MQAAGLDNTNALRQHGKQIPNAAVHNKFCFPASQTPTHMAQVELFRWNKFVMCIPALSSFLCLDGETEEESRGYVDCARCCSSLQSFRPDCQHTKSTSGLSRQDTAHQYITTDSHAARPAAPRSLLHASAQAAVPGISQTEALQPYPDKTAARPLKWTLKVLCIHLQPTWFQ